MKDCIGATRPPKRAAVRLLAALGTALLALIAAPAAAQGYPERTVRIINPFPAGGSGDAVTRAVFTKVSAALGQSFIVESRAGAAGAIGSDYVAEARPDGYTLLVGTSSTLAVNPSTQKNLPYDAVKDFTPVIMMATAPFVLLSNPSVPANTLPEFVAYVSANAGKLNYGSFGNGSSNHLAYELLRHHTGMEIVHVPYKGGAPMIAGLLGNEVQSALDLSTTVMPHVRSGKLKLLGIASGKRSALLPDVPTLAEQGHPVEAGTFFSIMGPAQMPPEIVRILNREINEALALPEIREKLAALGTEVVGGTPEALADTVAKELAKWRDVVRDRNLKLE